MDVGYSRGIENVRRDVNEDMKKRLMVSLRFMEEITGKSNYEDYFCSLCVMRKTRPIPCKILCRAFGESSADSLAVIRVFEDFSILSVKFVGRSRLMEVALIHDLVLDVVGEVAASKSCSALIHRRLIESFRPKDEQSTGEVQSNESSSTSAPPNSSIFSATQNMMHSFILRHVFNIIPTGLWSSHVTATTVRAVGTPRFQDWWLQVDDDDDNYIFKNIMRLLNDAHMFEVRQWLFEQSSWLTKLLGNNRNHNEWRLFFGNHYGNMLHIVHLFYPYRPLPISPILTPRLMSQSATTSHI